jgi:hypothetical protein
MREDHSPFDDTVTVLRSHGPLLAKRISKNGISDYDDANHFDVTQESVVCLDDVGSLLQRLITARRCCAIRGALIAPRHRGVRRLLRDDGGRQGAVAPCGPAAGEHSVWAVLTLARLIHDPKRRLLEWCGNEGAVERDGCWLDRVSGSAMCWR